MTTYYSISDIRREHNGKWFDPSSMRFFRSRVGENVYQGLGGVYFVSSEQFVNLSAGHVAARKYTVRQYRPDADQIKTVGEFNVLSKSQAHRLAKQYAIEGISH